MAAFEISTFIIAVLISIALIFFVIWNVSGEGFLNKILKVADFNSFTFSRRLLPSMI